ncbi:MAG: hypothetical protein ACOYBP_07610 [Microbacteriaceae bacterium]
MTLAEAGQKYLSIVCPANAGGGKLNEAIINTPDDLAAIQAAAAQASEALRTATKQLQDTSILWPDEVSADDLTTLANSNLAALSVMNSIQQVGSIDELNTLSFPDDNSGEAAQRIRLALDLPSNTQTSCAGVS